MDTKRAFQQFGLILTILLLTVICVQAAGRVMVVRDGSLVFASPDNSSAVMDILSRGAVLELLEEGADWHHVRIPDEGGEGYIVSDAVSETLVPLSFSPDSIRVGSSGYLEMQRSLDEAQEKMRRISSVLERLENKLDHAAMAKAEMTTGPAGSRPGAGTETGGLMGGLESHDLAVTAFYGAMLENTDFAAGVSVAWFPGLPAGLGLDFEGGAMFPEDDSNSYWGQVGIRYPLGSSERFLPYLSFGGGFIRREMTGGTEADETHNNPVISTGAGLVVKLAGRAAITIDGRYFNEFTESESVQDARIYLGGTILR